MGAIVGRRHGLEVVADRPVKDPKNVEMRETLDVGETRLEVRKHLEHAFSLVLGARALGNLRCVRVGAANETDGAKGEHGWLRGKTASASSVG
jgi:hypothetical protein